MPEKSKPVWNPKADPVLTLLNDAPLRDQCEGECFLLSDRFAAVYDAIRHESASTPFAVMVSGDWGSGKTSAMRWLDSQLNLWNKEEKGVRVDTCWFYPWKYQSSEEVWKGLISEVILAGMDFQNVDAGKVVKAAKQFGKFLGNGFVRLLSSLKIKDPSGESLEIDVKEALSGVIEEYGKHVTPQKAYFNAFEDELKSWIEDCYTDKRRLCIFIDDLDRCMPDIALQVLEALKLYLNIENLVFVVGVDKAVIESIVLERYEKMVGKDRFSAKLSDGDPFDQKAKKYLDKMFQIEVNVQPRDHQVQDFLESQLSQLQWWNELGEDHRYWLNILLGRKARQNPRAVVREINKLIIGAGSASDALERVQGIQMTLAVEACDNRHHANACRTVEGRQFLRAWSEALSKKGRDAAHYLPNAKSSIEQKGDALGEGKTKSGSEEISPFQHLLEVYNNPTYLTFRDLMEHEEIGLLMRLPFPPETGRIVEGSASGTISLVGQATGTKTSSQITERNIEFLRPLVSQSLGVAPEQIDEDFLSKLKELNLSFAKITDAGVEHLKQLTGLAKLWLHNNQITDAGVEHLKELTGLTQLSLNGNQITDAGVEPLKGLTGLTHLSLAGNQITEASLKTLRKQLPQCMII